MLITAVVVYVAVQVGESWGTEHLQPDPASVYCCTHPGIDAPLGGDQMVHAMPTVHGAVGARVGRFDLEVGGGNIGRWSQGRQLSYCTSRGVSTGACDISGYGVIAHELDVRVRYWQPVTERFSAYAEGGYDWVHWHVEQWRYSSPYTGHFVGSNGFNFAPEVGLGVGFDLTPRWSLTGGGTGTFNVRGARFFGVNGGVRYSFR
jgi:hypothetical protein